MNFNLFFTFIFGLPNIVRLSIVDLVFIPILFKPNSIFFILSDSLCLSSLIPLNLDIPLEIEAATNSNGNSSIAEGTNFFHILWILVCCF